jgi:hypothetical protein
LTPVETGRGFLHRNEIKIDEDLSRLGQLEHSRRKSVMAMTKKQELIMLSTILVVILILILVGALPTWGYSSGWGYGPGGIVGLLLIVVIVLALTGRI